jgi:hypothetical protein
MTYVTQIDPTLAVNHSEFEGFTAPFISQITGFFGI